MVTFPKEQSWKIDFATEIITVQPINRVIKGVGKVTTAPENVTTLIAATEGKVRYNNNVAVGASVRSGETLFTLETGDVADNNAAIKFAEAESRYNYTKGEYERKKELVKTRIVTLGDYQSAEAAYLQAKAVYENLKKNFNSGKMELKAPVTGYISDIAVAGGDYVAEGTPLATLQRDGEVQLFCEVSVRHAEALRNVTDINIVLNDGTCLSLDQIKGRITGIGRSIQQDCNMIPVTVVAKELKGVVPGNIVNMYLIAPEKSEGIVVPNTALVEEMGRYFVFVQHTPILFEKRLVVPGVTDGRNTRINSGIKSGERVVTNGAISLKLAQGTGALDPHAGHVH
jgi:RND family efflux transporter MFP subunit